MLNNYRESYDESDVEWGSTLYVASFINWKRTTQSVKCGLCTCGYSLYKNQDSREKVLIHRDYLFVGEVASTYEGEMKALLEGIERVPHEEPLTIRTTQPSIANGINRDLALWAEHDWCTKQGTLVKCQQEWQELLQILEGRKIVALCTHETEFVLLQLNCKALLRVHS